MKNFFLLFIFFLLWYISPIPQFYDLTSSFFAATIAILLLFYFKTIAIDRTLYVTKRYFNFNILLFILMSVHTIIAFLMFSKGINTGKYLASVFVLFIFLYSAYLFGHKLEESDQSFLNKMLKMFFILMLLIGSFSLTKIITSSQHAKPVFPYTEPSHYALFFVSLLYYTAIKAGKWRILVIFSGLLIALIVENLTLLVAVSILSLSVFRWRALFILPIVVLFVLNNFDLDYFSSRLNFTEDVNNLSTLVYIQGWELMRQSLEMSNGLGLGFQQLGEIPMKRTPAGEIIYMITKDDYNLKDGGFTLAKLVSEFGIAGIILSFLYLILFVKCFNKLGSKKLLQEDNVYIYAIAVITAYFSEFLVRGVGYFNPTTFMFFVALFIYFRYSKRKKEENDEPDETDEPEHEYSVSKT
ncbi:MAG: hypothetical protein QM564_13020 [Bergeyella sp.]